MVNPLHDIAHGLFAALAERAREQPDLFRHPVDVAFQHDLGANCYRVRARIQNWHAERTFNDHDLMGWGQRTTPSGNTVRLIVENIIRERIAVYLGLQREADHHAERADQALADFTARGNVDPPVTAAQMIEHQRRVAAQHAQRLESDRRREAQRQLNELQAQHDVWDFPPGRIGDTLRIRMPPDYHVNDTRDFVSPETRANELLANSLTRAQLEEFAVHGYFSVTGSEGGKYRIRKGRSFNIDRIDDQGVWSRICVVPVGAPATGDIMLAQKVSLETDEKKALKIANHQRIREPASAATNARLGFAEIQRAVRQPVDNTGTTPPAGQLTATDIVNHALRRLGRGR